MKFYCLCLTNTYLWFCWIYSRQKSSELIYVIGVLRRLRRIRSLMRRRLFTLGHVQTRSMPRKKIVKWLDLNIALLQFDEKNWCVSWDWSRGSDSIVCEQRTWRRFQTDWKLPPTIFGVQTSQNFELHQCCGVASWCMYTGKLNVSNIFQADNTEQKSISNCVINGVFSIVLSKCNASSC